MSNLSKVALRQIAEETGVSRMAVSLALRGKPGVSEATRRNILRTAERLGFQSDPDVARLMAHLRSKSSTESRACLALLTSGNAADDWKQSVTERKYIEGTRERAKEYGYRVETFWLNDPALSAERLADVIWNRGIDGVIFAPLQGRLSQSASRSINFDVSRFVVVEISETIESPDLDRSIHDQYTSTLKLLDELAALNYRNFGLVLEEALDLRVNGKWTAAFLRHRLSRPGKKAPPLLLASPDQAAFDRWFNRHRPDVIISVDQLGLRFLKNRNLRIPEDIGYASLDLDGLPAGSGISGIDQNSRLVGAAAVDMLVAGIHRNKRGSPDHPLRTQVEGTWIAGNSTCRQNAG